MLRSGDAPWRFAPRVLALQSHVVRGHVGSEAFSFSLQRLGVDVGCIHTCQFVDLETHRGSRLTADQLHLLLEHFPPASFSSEQSEEADSLPYRNEPPFRCVVSGFVGEPRLLRVLGSWIQKLREAKDKAAVAASAERGASAKKPPLFVCDPVLGDNRRLYVHPDCVQVYAEQLLPLADVVLPNEHEAAWLVSEGARQRRLLRLDEGRPAEQPRQVPGKDFALNSWSDALQAVDALHAMGPSVVVITSFSLGEAEAAKARELLSRSVWRCGQCAFLDEACTCAKPANFLLEDASPDLFILASRRVAEGKVAAGPSTEEENSSPVPDAASAPLLCMRVPLREGYVGGTGDLFCGLFTAWLLRSNGDLSKALQRTVQCEQVSEEDAREEGSAEWEGTTTTDRLTEISAFQAPQAVLLETFAQSPRPKTVDVVSAQRFLAASSEEAALLPSECRHPVFFLTRTT